MSYRRQFSATATERSTVEEEDQPTKTGKTRINVNLTDSSYQMLKEMAYDSGIDMSELVRNALRVYTTLIDERNRGKTVYIGTRDKIEKELIIP
jgi:hypothetical protein